VQYKISGLEICLALHDVLSNYRQSQGSALEQLEQACQSWAPEDRGASKDLNDWQHQLRSLLQAGIPMVSSLVA